jgi:hypothetical protein
MNSKIKYLTVAGLACAAAIGMLTQKQLRPGHPKPFAPSLSPVEQTGPWNHGDQKAGLPASGGESGSQSLPPPVKAVEKRSSAREQLRAIAATDAPSEWQAFLDSVSAPGEKEALLECIGESGRAESSGFLKGMLNADAQPLRRAAMRGLAATGRTADAKLLGDIMINPSIAIEETTEAALALGGMKAANATGMLVSAYSKDGVEELQQCILIGLSQRPFQESESFLRQMLADPSESSSRKKEVLESLGQFDSVRDSFFVPFMESPEVDVRRGAYQGLGKLAETQLGYLLLPALQKETEDLARADIYEALCSQNSGNRLLLNQIAGAETDPMTRLIAARAVASSLRGLPEGDPAVGVFNRQWVPGLVESALKAGSAEGMQAVFALMSAQSFRGPRQALEQIGGAAEDSKVRGLAQKALSRIKKNQ